MRIKTLSKEESADQLTRKAFVALYQAKNSCSISKALATKINQENVQKNPLKYIETDRIETIFQDNTTFENHFMPFFTKRKSIKALNHSFI